MSTLGYIAAKSAILLKDKNVQKALGTAGTAVLVAAKEAVIVTAPIVIPFAVGAAASYGLMKGVTCVVDKVTESD